jgi:hypothetical protein
MKSRFVVWARIVVAAAALLSVPSGCAHRGDPVLEVYRLSGTRDQLRQYPEGTAALIRANRGEMTPRVFQAMQTAARVATDSTRMDDLFLERFRAQLSPKTASRALRFFESPVGKAVAQAERRAASPKGVVELEVFRKQNPAPRDPARARLLQVLDTATGSSDVAIEESLAMTHALAFALDAARPPEQRRGSEELWRLVRQYDAEDRSNAKQDVLSLYTYVYRTLSMEELREYIRFAISDEGLEYHRVLSRLLALSHQEFGAVLARAFVREMGTE